MEKSAKKCSFLKTKDQVSSFLPKNSPLYEEVPRRRENCQTQTLKEVFYSWCAAFCLDSEPPRGKKPKEIPKRKMRPMIGNRPETISGPVSYSPFVSKSRKCFKNG